MKLCKTKKFTWCPYCQHKVNSDYCEYCGVRLNAHEIIRRTFWKGLIDSLLDPSQAFLIVQAILLVVLLVVLYL